MTATMALPTSRFDAGRVVAASFAVIRRQWRTILPLAIAEWAVVVAEDFALPVHYNRGSHDLGSFAAYWALALSVVSIGWLKDAAIVCAALEGQDRRPLVQAVRGSLLVFLPLLPFRLVASGPALMWNAWSSWALVGRTIHIIEVDLGVGATLWLYGVGLRAFFGLVVPVALAERGPLLTALRRSSDLLSLGRWRFLALSILTDFIGALPATFGGLMVTFLLTRLIAYHSAATYYRIEGVIVGLLASLVTAAWLVITAVAYKEFRRLREGAPYDQVAAIFA